MCNRLLGEDVSAGWSYAWARVPILLQVNVFLISRFRNSYFIFQTLNSWIILVFLYRLCQHICLSFIYSSYYSIRLFSITLFSAFGSIFVFRFHFLLQEFLVNEIGFHMDDSIEERSFVRILDPDVWDFL